MDVNEILVIGINSCGKSTLIDTIEQLTKTEKKTEPIVSDVPFRFTFPRNPTHGIEIKKIPIEKQIYHFREIGGALRTMWCNFIKRSKKIIYLIDASDHTTVAAASVELREVLGHPDSKGIPFLIVLNKIDIACGVLLEEVQIVLRLDTLEEEARSRIYFCEIVATSGENVDKIIDWVIEGTDPKKTTKKKS
ncbi:Arl16 [Monocercomonoides exilis]|uniref:Arl16 n=1 Tax=Monocercomonoides exilis TaxID=2049356 RepID=UPI00355ABD13|nr:Arl16 [Monocercomonoides exilis]|eukprot:MONOS_3418.1-p1 / transcript=MONOS_3418.1 / gene=MONOS_3418 / organism=Monocercomonoides_exilis_PA203 / gene_product=Arl16 / transcript_product=Arl16 / location=Mono_scaffold00080:96564-97465(+) / protein_length=192 / sequence_SO=supercontig / SO=protein_coding / is_pseudo=false